jgi:hypothetical protein
MRTTLVIRRTNCPNRDVRGLRWRVAGKSTENAREIIAVRSGRISMVGVLKYVVP